MHACIHVHTTYAHVRPPHTPLFFCFCDDPVLSRGDVGSWVREAAMVALTDIAVDAHTAASCQPHAVVLVAALAKQAVERIARVRQVCSIETPLHLLQYCTYVCLSCHCVLSSSYRNLCCFVRHCTCWLVPYLCYWYTCWHALTCG